MSPFFASIPLVVLVVSMTVRWPAARLPLPAHVALPVAAGLALVVQVVGGVDAGARLLLARVVEGLLTSLMPLAIVFGAVLLFRVLSASGATRAIMRTLERSTPDPVIRVMLIAWSFSYLIEGLSGFGTPAALAAPLLVGLGFGAVRAAAACLVMNTVPVVFGAVGTPMWFGMGQIGLSGDELLATARHAAVLQCVVAPVAVVCGLRLLFRWREIRSRALAIMVIVAVTVAGSAVVSVWSTEFPSIVGGLCGLTAAFVAGRMRGGAGAGAGADGVGALVPAWRAFVPLVATVVLLAVTRLEPLGLRALLTSETPALTLSLGGVGELSVSAALVVGVADILGSGIAWSIAFLYVPFIVPFVLVSLATAPLLGLSARQTLGAVRGTAGSLALPAVALAAALVFVKLMMHGGAAAPVQVVGGGLADLVSAVYGPLWLGVAPAMGALGSFFSGSATVSNLTFAPMQAEIAGRLGLDLSRVLALQAIGAAMGNMVCVHNIVAVAAVLGLVRGRVSPPADDRVAGSDQDWDGGSDWGSDGGSGGDAGGVSDDPVAGILRRTAVPLAIALLAIAAAASVLALA